MSVVGRLRTVVMLALLGACGCASPRFVSLGPEGGTLAMPSNSSRYHKEALQMLDEKFPNGYTIDREHEVVVGQVQTDHTTDHDVLFGREVEHRTEVHDRTEWHIDFHPKGVEVAHTPAKPALQQASYSAPVKEVRALPKEPVPVP